jgi:hypothetical protein
MLRVDAYKPYTRMLTENPCVGGSIPPQATNIQSQLFSVGFVVSGLSACHVGCLTGLPVLTA